MTLPAKKLIGIGVDSVSWNRMERFLTSHSFEHLKRLLTTHEQRELERSLHPLQFFSRLFAAKEAYFKALGEEWMGEEGFRETGVVVEGTEKFRVTSGGFETEGRFFKTPDGIGARLSVWEGSALS